MKTRAVRCREGRALSTAVRRCVCRALSATVRSWAGLALSAVVRRGGCRAHNVDACAVRAGYFVPALAVRRGECQVPSA